MIPYHTIPHLTFGAFSIESYRLLVYTAAFVGLYIAYRETLRKKESVKHLTFLIISGIIGLVIGARLFFYFGPWTWHLNISILARFSKFLMFWNSGVVFYGGLIGSLVAIFMYCKIKKLNFWRYMDIFAPALGIVVFISRIGCFLGGCCYGNPTNVPWAIIRDGIPIHPTQIYSSLNGLILFFLILFLRKKERKDGFLALIALLYYSITRFIIEFFRHNVSFFAGLSASQWISICLFAFSSLVLWKMYNKKYQIKSSKI